jgi:hypothetical protein
VGSGCRFGGLQNHLRRPENGFSEEESDVEAPDATRRQAESFGTKLWIEKKIYMIEVFFKFEKEKYEL